MCFQILAGLAVLGETESEREVQERDSMFWMMVDVSVQDICVCVCVFIYMSKTMFSGLLGMI